MIDSPVKVEMNLRDLFLYVFNFGKFIESIGGRIVDFFKANFVGLL